MDIEQILSLVGNLAEPAEPVYLVGGAVRDRLLNRDSHDLDFLLLGPTGPLARRVANALSADFYVLDPERDTSRVLLSEQGAEQVSLDFASLRADELEGDLRARDFSINAMAFRLDDEESLIDPCGGLADLRRKRLRACGPNSLEDDPARVLRAVRLSVELGYRIEEKTVQMVRNAAGSLSRVSAERQRDEMVRMMERARTSLCIRILDRLDVLPQILPDLLPLKGLKQPAPHVQDAWEHTLAVLDRLEDLLAVLAGHPKAASPSGLVLGSVLVWLGRYQENIIHHLSIAMPNGRSLTGLLKLAALYHDAGKATTSSVGKDGRLHFLGHEVTSARLAGDTLRRFAFSSDEVERCVTIIREHMRVHHLTETGRQPSSRSIYRFFRDTGAVGVEVCILSLADTWATYGHTLPQDHWLAELQTCRALLDGLWEKPEQIVNPPRLVDGNDLISSLQLKPGRVIGILLEAIREAQAAGEIQTKDDALVFARAWIHDQEEIDNGESKR